MNIAEIFEEAKQQQTPVNVSEIIQYAEKYEYLSGLTTAKLRDQLYRSLTTLPSISPETVADLWGKLTEYRYVYSLDQLRRGRFIRWIDLGGKTYTLSYGGMVVDVEITAVCPMILCKTPVGKMVKFDFNKNRVYQKLTTEEKMVIMCANEAYSGR